MVLEKPQKFISFLYHTYQERERERERERETREERRDEYLYLSAFL